MYISCIFHVLCASFSALATQELANAKAVFSGIWAIRCINMLDFVWQLYFEWLFT